MSMKTPAWARWDCHWNSMKLLLRTQRAQAPCRIPQNGAILSFPADQANLRQRPGTRLIDQSAHFLHLSAIR